VKELMELKDPKEVNELLRMLGWGWGSNGQCVCGWVCVCKGMDVGVTVNVCVGGCVCV
jgi:hypothetical protein